MTPVSFLVAVAFFFLGIAIGRTATLLHVLTHVRHLKREEQEKHLKEVLGMHNE